MYRPQTRAVPSPTSATHSSQCSTRLRHHWRQGQGVVLAQVLLVEHLEPDVLGVR